MKQPSAELTEKRGLYRGSLSPSRQQSLSTGEEKLAWPVLLFLIALLVPWAIQVGSLRLSPYRLVLILMIVPCLQMWITGKMGPKRAADVFLISYSFWCFLSLFVNHGVAPAVQPAGITGLETLGPYLLARRYIRNADDFHRLFRLLFKIVLVLWPFAIVELLTGWDIWRDILAAIWPVQVLEQMPPRAGLYRVQMGFDHPILFGMCIGTMLAPVYLGLGFGKSLLQRSAMGGIVGGLTLTSVSAGPLIGILLQAALLAWNDVLKSVAKRWQILVGLGASLWLAVELVANRSVLNIIVTSLVFDPGSYWFRLTIWDFGTASVAKYPIFGVGLNEWERPDWVVGLSIDNFWLFVAVRYGLPASILFVLSMLSIFLGLAYKSGLDERTAAYRTAVLISMVAIFVVAWSVHYWDATYAFILFFMGSAIWIFDVGEQQNGARQAVVKPRRASKSRRDLEERLVPNLERQ